MLLTAYGERSLLTQLSALISASPCAEQLDQYGRVASLLENNYEVASRRSCGSMRRERAGASFWISIKANGCPFSRVLRAILRLQRLYASSPFNCKTTTAP